jgi:predicted NBD/HSP70 family sugar kinase
MLGLIQAAFIARITTKPELAKIMNLTLPTVHNFIGELVTNNIVVETGSSKSHGGRRAIQYSFNADIYHILGVRILPNNIDIGLFDMLLNCIQKEQYPIDLAIFTPEEGMQYIIYLIKEMIIRWNVEPADLLEIGITFPGPVDDNRGLILELPNLPHWKNIPAKAILERELKLSVVVEKDSFSNVIGLKWLNCIQPDSSVVYVNIGVGVGIGFLNDGQLYRGKHRMMGEIGHISIDPNGMLCNCGGRGCLELYASDIGIIRRVSERVKNGESELISKFSRVNKQIIDMPIILAAELLGDAVAREEIEFSLKYLSECITDIIKLYDPDKVIIGHPWLDKYPAMKEKVYKSIFLDSVFCKPDSVSVEFNKIPNLELLSAAAIVVEHQFSSSDNSKLLALLTKNT